MIYLTFILPVTIVLVCPKYAFWSLFTAILLLFVGLMTVNYVEAQAFLDSLDGWDPEITPNVFGLAFSFSLMPLAIGFIVLRILHYLRQRVHRKKVTRQQAERTFE
jgi:uncharacterized membrane protein